MSGVKGRSGGARPGSGPKPAPKVERPHIAAAETPLAFLTAVMNDVEQDPRLRVRAAVAAAQYVHGKVGEDGKKDDKRRAAKDVSASGRFQTPQGPKLVVSR